MNVGVARIALVAGVLGACGNSSSSPKEKGRASECFAYTAPAGWKESPSKTKAALKLASPEEVPLGDKKMWRDSFTVDYLPWEGSLEAFKTQLLASMTQANLDSVIAQHANDNPAVSNVKSGVPESRVTTTTLGGREAFRIENRNTITADGMQVGMVNVTVVAKFGDEVVVVAVGELGTREAQVQPLAAAFLASINFDRCK